MKLIVSADAEADLRSIVRLGSSRWGPGRARGYVRGLRDQLRSLVEYPERGAPAKEISEDLRRCSYLSHKIYYRVGERQVRIVRILHKRMRAEEYLR